MLPKLKMYQLRGDSACNKRRNFKYQVNDTKSENYYKACATLRAAKGILKGESLGEIEAQLVKDFEEIPYQETQRKVLIADTMKEIKRYVEWEKRPLAEAVTADINLYGKMDVEVTPSFIVADANPVIEEEKQTVKDEKGKNKTVYNKIKVADGYIEIIKLKTGKPISYKATDESLELLSMLMYGRKFYRQGKLQIRASFYYLRKNSDSHGEKPLFEPFDYDQIRTLTEVYEGKENDTDKKFEPIVEDFVNGHDETDCNPKDCENCIMYNVCKGYSDGPMSSDREIITKAVDIRLNDYQQRAIDY